jgi:hypothetical protein
MFVKKRPPQLAALRAHFKRRQRALISGLTYARPTEVLIRSAELS